MVEWFVLGWLWRGIATASSDAVEAQVEFSQVGAVQRHHFQKFYDALSLDSVPVQKQGPKLSRPLGLKVGAHLFHAPAAHKIER